MREEWQRPGRRPQTTCRRSRQKRNGTSQSGLLPFSYLIIRRVPSAETDAQPESLVQVEGDDLGSGIRQRYRHRQLRPFGDQECDQTGHKQTPATVGGGFQDASQMAFQVRSSLPMADANLSVKLCRAGLCKGVSSPAVLACGSDHPNHVSRQEKQFTCPAWRSEMASTGQTLMQLPQRMQLSLSIQM